MAPAPILYRETRLTPAPASPSHTLHIPTFSERFRAGSKRPFDEISGSDEETYARKCLATEGSVFFRSKARSPRSFLWRVLEDRKVLEIQAVDLVKERGFENTDSWLTFRITFKDAILERGIVLADVEETDALECFVLTEGRELVTVTLRRDLLTRANVPAEFDAGTCVKKYTSSFLSVRHPYHFVAISSLELLVSLADGGLVRLQRKVSESGAQWRETFFSEGGWRGTLTLKGLNPFAGRPTVRYGSLELDATAIADMVSSPDGKYVWTVSLDHYLRAWSTESGKVAIKQDLLNDDRQNERHPYTMSAEQGRLLQIVTPQLPTDSQAVTKMNQDGKYAVVVHSPRDHQFKMYDITYTSTLEGERISTQDFQPGNRLIPPVDELMNTNIWHLEYFSMQPGVEWMDTQLWIRARSGALAKTFMLTFDVLDEDGSACDLTQSWASAWSVVDPGPLTVDGLKCCADYPGAFETSADAAVTPSEQWLQFLCYPGRFTAASLETALYEYRRARGIAIRGSSGKGLKTTEQPLEGRLTAAITSKVLLRRLPNETPDYENYQQDIQAQWQLFWTVLVGVHNRRHEAIGFAFDAAGGLPWTICADFVAPVRACSAFERRVANTDLLYDDLHRRVDDEIYSKIYPARFDQSNDNESPYESVFFSRLLDSARQLHQTLSYSARMTLQTEAERQALAPREELPDTGHAEAMFEKLHMEGQIGDDDFDALSEGLEGLGGLGSLSTDMFVGILEWLDEPEVIGRSEGRDLARYGVSFTVEMARETLMRARGVLLDVLALVVFMAGDLEKEELDDEFSADQVYDAIMERLKRVQLLLWLASTQREKVTDLSKTVDLPQSSEQDVEVIHAVTLLEDVFMGDWRAVESDEGTSMPLQLTSWTKHWTRGLAFEEARWSGVTTYILARLVKHKETGMAVDFLKFTDRGSKWAVYVQARLHLAIGDYAQASLDFQEAAEGMASSAVESEDGANLLSAHELSSFGNGKAAYYQHSMALFEKLKVYSYVADFAMLALQNTQSLPNFSRSMAAVDKRKSSQDSPAHERIAAVEEEMRLLRLKETRNEILNRLFNAQMQTGRFSGAFGALEQIEDPPMKRSGLKKLLDACVRHEAVPTLLGLPFEGDLAQEADRALLDMAKKDLASGSSSATTPYYHILYSFRTQRSDFRGAAEILYEHVERMRNMPLHHTTHDPEDETLLQAYVLFINTLACCGEEDAWLLADPIAGVHKEGRKRKLVTLADVRREYTAELDRRSDILQGRFPLIGGDDEMDVL